MFLKRSMLTPIVVVFVKNNRRLCWVLPQLCRSVVCQCYVCYHVRCRQHRQQREHVSVGVLTAASVRLGALPVLQL